MSEAKKPVPVRLVYDVWFRDDVRTAAGAIVPATMSGKAFSGNIVVGTSTYQTDGNIVFSGGMSAYGANMAAALTSKANLSGATFSGTVTAADLVSNGDIFAGGGDVLVRSNGNRHLWYQSLSGVNRGLLYHDNAASHLSLQLYNNAGTYVRRLTFYEGGVAPKRPDVLRFEIAS
ncbi:hypothetical protein [Ensifer sp. SSB1]|uniref:hypothetical protein n=1 Tax=Ensifer sp. SSB1 TaxID=2795385 RepID=UPI001A5DE18D|nr:hypothetical protein [Ensifer sp. SSB1]MBK5569941.1 hypothetical protein [Ensifer sp. SSB1]